MLKIAQVIVPVLLLLCNSCHLGPSYETPQIEAPSEWKKLPKEESAPPCVDNWWEVFEDEKLNCLEKQAIANNPNLHAALERVFQAWAVVGVDRAALFPQITLNPSYTDTGELFKIYLPSGVQKIPGFTGINTVYRVHEFQYVLPLNMSYELDLWGQVRGQYRSAALGALAQEQAYRAAILTLTADLASNYFELRSLDAQADVLKATMEVRKKAMDINNSRFSKGNWNRSRRCQCHAGLF